MFSLEISPIYSAAQYKVHAQFLRLFSLHDDVNDAHRAGANRLQNKQTRRENIEMVKWIGKFSLLLKRLRDAWMDLLPTSSVTTEQVTTHERSFPCSDKLTTLMFIVASDLSETQRERLTSSLFSPGSECRCLHN